MATEKLVVGDARNLSTILHDELRDTDKLAVTITSPPYWNLKDYSSPGQIGWTQEYDQYLDDCESIFAQIYDRTNDTGSLWVISDTLLDQRSKPSRVIQLPFDLAGRAERAGWALRDVYIWKKDRTLPFTSPGRVRNAFEYIHFFVKSDDFKFHVDRLRDPVNLTKWWVQYPERYNPKGKAPTNVWDIPIPTQGAWSNGAIQHACPLPPDMIERIVLLTTDLDDIVFDPFAGTGAVLAEARRLGRVGVGIELNPAYVDTYMERVRQVVLDRDDDPAADAARESQRLATLIRALRVVKFPKSLARAYLKAHGEALPAICVHVESDDYDSAERPTLRMSVVVDDPEIYPNLNAQLTELSMRYPLSQFQLRPSFIINSAYAFTKEREGQSLYFYEHGRTWSSTGQGSRPDALLLGRSPKVGKYAPIVSSIKLNEVAHRPYA